MHDRTIKQQIAEYFDGAFGTTPLERALNGVHRLCADKGVAYTSLYDRLCMKACRYSKYGDQVVERMKGYVVRACYEHTLGVDVVMQQEVTDDDEWAREGRDLYGPSRLLGPDDAVELGHGVYGEDAFAYVKLTLEG